MRIATRIRTVCVLLLAAGGCAHPGQNGVSAIRPPVHADAPPRGYVCRQATSPIQIDGRLDEAAWSAAAWTDDFVDIVGDPLPRPRYATRARMLWDERYFYIGAWLEEPHVRATLKKRDSVIFHDNDFEVFIDPDGANVGYCELEINALNTVWDLRLPRPYRDDGAADNHWDIIGLRTGVHVDGTLNDPRDTDRGWSVEIAIPWPALGGVDGMRVPPREGDEWRVNFSRVEWRHTIRRGRYETVPRSAEDNWVWSPQGVIDMHRPERWGYVQFTARSGDVPFVPDEAWPVRAALMRVYYAQRDFHVRYGRWAQCAAELRKEMGDAELLRAMDRFDIRIEPTAGGYAATSRGWCVRQDSELRHVEAASQASAPTRTN